MARSRMFGGDKPQTPSPRTTIVGGRPPEDGAQLPPVPTGIQRLLRLASADADFFDQLVEKRGEAAEAAGVELTASERAILRAVPAVQLRAMVASMPPPPIERRSFLRRTAAMAVLALGGAALSGSGSCSRDDTPERARDRGMTAAGGAAPDEPPEPSRIERPSVREMETDGGAAPDLPEPPPRPDYREFETSGGAAPDLPDPPAPPRPERRDMARKGGAAPDEPPPCEDIREPAPERDPHPPKSRGISPDRPPRRRKQSRPSRGIRPDYPPPKPAPEDNPFGEPDSEPASEPDNEPNPFPGSD